MTAGDGTGGSVRRTGWIERQVRRADKADEDPLTGGP